MLAQLGVVVAIHVVPVADFFDQYITPGQFDFTVFSWIGTPFPISSAKSIYINPQENAEGEMEVQQNYARVGSEAIDQLFDQAKTEFDPGACDRDRQPDRRPNLAGSPLPHTLSATGDLRDPGGPSQLRCLRLRATHRVRGHRLGHHPVGHCQLVEGSALLPREIDAPECSQQAHVTASHSTNARVRSRRW